MARFKVSDLKCDHVDTVAVHVDWRDAYRDADPDNWPTVYETVGCPDCGAEHVMSPGDCRECRDLSDDSGEAPKVDDCRAEVEGPEGPMMNYLWPCEWDTADDARKVTRFPVCLVEHDGTKGISLTGGGMDLSWEIAGAYVALGYLPPAAIRLPRMAQELRPWQKRVISAMRRSYRVQIAWAQNRARDLRDLKTWYAELPARRAEESRRDAERKAAQDAAIEAAAFEINGKRGVAWIYSPIVDAETLAHVLNRCDAGEHYRFGLDYSTAIVLPAGEIRDAAIAAGKLRFVDGRCEPA